MNQSQMTGLTTGVFDTLYVRLPPDELVSVADTIGKVEQLESGASTQNQELQALQEDVDELTSDVEALQIKQETRDNEIQSKQNILTARFPLKIQDDIISLGFLSTQDAEAAAIARAGHLQATDLNTANVTELQALVADQATLISQLRADVDGLLPATTVWAYAELTGNSYIQFDSGFDDAFDWTKSWSAGVDLFTLPDTIGDNLKGSLFTSGGGALTLHRSGPPGISQNYGSYNSSCKNLYNVIGRANANTWSSPLPNSRLLYVFDHTTSKLQYFIGSKGGSYSRKANITVPGTFSEVQQLGSGLEFGKAWSGTGGANFSGHGWVGGVGAMLVTTHAMTDDDIAEYFAVSGQDFSALSFPVHACLKPGSAYPVWVDATGNVPDGALIGGTAEAFKEA